MPCALVLVTENLEAQHAALPIWRRLEDTAACLVRNPLSLKRLVYLDGSKAVLYRSRVSPSLGRNLEAMDPLEWLARMSDHILDPGQHRTLFYAEYSHSGSRLRKPGRS